jgi:hypothetical protein
MPAIATPLAADKLADWQRWVGELTDTRKAEFEDMNTRHGLDEHRAYLQPMPDGNYLVLAVHEGPGAENFLAAVLSSDHEFDRWFAETVADIHGFDPGAGLPPVAARRL